MAHHSRAAPLFIYLPPFAPAPGEHVELPDVLQPWPIAVIRYRWGDTHQTHQISEDDEALPSLQWPTPVHDTAFAFEWVTQALAPDKVARRDIYVYGSHLGASLAASLGLTESHPHAKFSVRGVVAYNGIYNWTMFLPDHRINRPSTRAKGVVTPPQPVEGSHLHILQNQLRDLFEKPGSLFDPFASACLLFHGPGLLIPKSFTMSSADAANVDALASGQPSLLGAFKPPRRSHMVFPPRKSTLKIPPTLLLHDTPNLVSPIKRLRSVRKGNSFGTQAGELGELMRRSVDKIELKMRSRWDEDMEGWEGEAERRVRVVDVGEETEELALNEVGQAAVESWLDEVM